MSGRDDRRKKARWALDTTGMAKSGYAPRKATLAEWVVELADEADRLEAALRRSTYLARHLLNMIPQEVWRDAGGDDGQGHYEGEYHAAGIREELEKLAALVPEGESL